jgi:flagellar biogenesis protein FliO
MMDTLWRLAWALPLVLATGMAAALTLRRFVARTPDTRRPTQRMTLRESLTLSDDTRLHLIEVDRQAFLVVESARHTSLQPTAVASDTTRLPVRFATPWTPRLFKSKAR